MDLVVGIGDYAISSRETDRILTFALASCVAVTVYSRLRKVAGMIHVALPSPLDASDIRARPCYFATTGLPILIDRMCRHYGCLKVELQIGIYGGADSIKCDDIFSIGKRNIAAVKNTLDSLYLQAHSIEVGGVISRTLKLDVSTGVVKVSTHPLTI